MCHSIAQYAQPWHWCRIDLLWSGTRRKTAELVIALEQLSIPVESKQNRKTHAIHALYALWGSGDRLIASFFTLIGWAWLKCLVTRAICGRILSNRNGDLLWRKSTWRQWVMTIDFLITGIMIRLTYPAILPPLRHRQLVCSVGQSVSWLWLRLIERQSLAIDWHQYQNYTNSKIANQTKYSTID